MNKCVLLLFSLLCSNASAWQTLAEMDESICLALTNDFYFSSVSFSNELVAATNSVSAEIKSEGHMLLSLRAYQNFLDSADYAWIQDEVGNASNAVIAIGTNSDKWQYWMSRFILAGAYVSIPDCSTTLAIVSNSLAEISSSNFTNDMTKVERAILTKFEMPDGGIANALRIMGGMSAAELGRAGMATNYANQVPLPYRNTILNFIK